MPELVFGYDDERVTLSDGSIDVDGVKVSGSVSFIRDPRLGRLADTLVRLSLRQALRLSGRRLDADMKYCYVCGDVRPKSYFSPRADTWDKLDPRCRGCEAERKRRYYREAVGRPVRKYERRQAATA